MSQIKNLPTAHRQLLERYVEAAQIIYKSKATQPPDGISNDPHDGAMQQLLCRQAQSLVSVGNASMGEEGHEKPDLRLISKRLEDVASTAVSKFYAYRTDRVPPAWRHIYTDALILTSFHAFASADVRLDDATLDRMVNSLDRALITTGGQGLVLGPKWIEDTLYLLEKIGQEQRENEDRPSKRQKLSTATKFPSKEPYGRPSLTDDKQCLKYKGWSLGQFEEYMNESRGGPAPVVFTDLMDEWPAVGDRPWNDVDYLLSRTIGGRRLVPVEVGRSYVDEGWGQELIQFKDFMHKYIVAADSSDSDSDSDSDSPRPTGYLAQHQLFRQIPSLRNDTRTPDFCWADVPKHPTDPSKDQPPLDMPQLNAWFGPARTITPLHTDGYHNLLCQVVGTKYVRLYPPSATPYMHPRPPDHGVDMSNTSAVDVGVLEGWDEPPDAASGGVGAEELGQIREQLGQLEYKECILEPGDTLLIPIGWWHYVRSLSISFSVSFWWN
jgi:mitochondrial division protein 1